jgi:hypothetical protein
MTETTARVVVYRLRLEITVPLDDYAECDTLSAEENAVCRESKHNMKVVVTHCLRRLPAGEVTDIEVMDASVEDE